MIKFSKKNQLHFNLVKVADDKIGVIAKQLRKRREDISTWVERILTNGWKQGKNQLRKVIEKQVIYQKAALDI